MTVYIVGSDEFEVTESEVEALVKGFGNGDVAANHCFLQKRNRKLTSPMVTKGVTKVILQAVEDGTAVILDTQDNYRDCLLEKQNAPSSS